MGSRSREKSPKAASRSTSSVQRSRRDPSPSGGRKRAAPSSGVRAKPKAASPKGRSVAALAAVSQESEPPVANEIAIVLPIKRPSAANGPSAYQQMYVDACSTSAGARVTLDTERFARALADASVGVLAEQRIYHLGVLAAADGEPSLAIEDVIAALAEGERLGYPTAS